MKYLSLLIIISPETNKIIIIIIVMQIILIRKLEDKAKLRLMLSYTLSSDLKMISVNAKLKTNFVYSKPLTKVDIYGKHAERTSIYGHMYAQ